jgi:hypothetical protein
MNIDIVGAYHKASQSARTTEAPTPIGSDATSDSE